MYLVSILTKVWDFVDFDKSKNYNCSQIGIFEIRFPLCRWTFLIQFTEFICYMVEIVRKIGKCWENNEKMKNYKIPISHLSALETLL